LTECPDPAEVIPENRVPFHAILQAKQICRKCVGRLAGNRVDHPVHPPLRFNQFTGLEIGEVFGNLDLCFVEKLLQMADAERPLGQQVKYPEPNRIREALIKGGKVHKQNTPASVYTVKSI
jgi:hypothetical protein